MTRRGAALEVAVLGLLHDAPMHGYELRKQVNACSAGAASVLGTLYPCLKALGKAGYIVADEASDVGRPAGAGLRSSTASRPRARNTSPGARGLRPRERGTTRTFGVRFAFFARTDAPTRVRILEGRRSRLEERLDNVRKAGQAEAGRVDSYTLELQRHGLESVEREVKWLTELIDRERSGGYHDDRAQQHRPQHDREVNTSMKENPWVRYA